MTPKKANFHNLRFFGITKLRRDLAKHFSVPKSSKRFQRGYNRSTWDSNRFQGFQRVSTGTNGFQRVSNRSQRVPKRFQQVSHRFQWILKGPKRLIKFTRSSHPTFAAMHFNYATWSNFMLIKLILSK